MTTFLCHNCSYINNPSGEACIILGPEDRKDEIIQGEMKCLKNYKNPVTEVDRKKASPIILPDEWEFETDFYIVASNEAENNYKHIISSHLWEVSFLQMRSYSNEEMLWRNAEEQIFKYKQNSHRQRRIESEITNLVSHFFGFLPGNH